MSNQLTHYGVKGMKWGVRRTPERRGSRKNTIAKRKKSDRIKRGKAFVAKSLGAKAKNYRIYDAESDEYYSLTEGTRIRNPKVFAGKGGVKSLRPEVVEGLTEKYPGSSKQGWQHCKGIASLDVRGESRDAEIHWFQEKNVGKHVFKIKRWFN